MPQKQRSKTLTARLVLCLLAAVLATATVVSAKKPITITTFDYPEAEISTLPISINNDGVIVGVIRSSSGAERGFVRFPDGTFSEPIVHPDNDGNFTRAIDISAAQTIVGDYFVPSENTFHGYFLSADVFTRYDFGGPVSTSIFGINDFEDIGGVFGSSVQPNQGFVRIGGVSTAFSVPGAASTFANDINNRNEVVGSKTDASGNTRGFFRAPDGTLTYPVDFPGATSTDLSKLNDRGWIVGLYRNSDGRIHGVFRSGPLGTFVTFDYPGAIVTSLTGVNQAGFITGSFLDEANVSHGFVARVKHVPKG